MTKAEIAEKLYDMFSDIPKKQCADLVDLVFDAIKKALASGEEVKISNFGKFGLQDKKARKGRNPQTGEKMIISKRRIVVFKGSPKLRDAVNEDPIPE